MAYIYQITNDVNGKIYIGKTEFSIEKRFKEHCRDSQKQTEEHRPLYAAMRKYGIEYFHVELLEETNSPEEREKYWIEVKGSFKSGYNATIGGDGKRYLDYELIIATYENVGEAKKVAKLLHYDENTVARIIRNHGFVLKTPRETGKLLGKKIAKCDKETGEILEIFASIKEAGLSIGKSHAHISDCANGKRKTAYGFMWKFL